MGSRSPQATVAARTPEPVVRPSLKGCEFRIVLGVLPTTGEGLFIPADVLRCSSPDIGFK